MKKNSQTNSFQWLIGSLILATFCSCTKTVDTSTTVQTEPEPTPTLYHVVIIGGFESDPTEEQVAGTAPRRVGNSGMYQLKGDLEKQDVDCSFYNWNGTDARKIFENEPPGASRIADEINSIFSKEPTTEFFLVGHSWGGHTLMEVADLLLKNAESPRINLALAIDPSSLMRGNRAKELPANIPTLINYHTGNAFCWGAWKNEPRAENINLGDEENGFMQNGYPKYDSAFDTGAHTSAEWDDKIHADVCKRILALIQD